LSPSAVTARPPRRKPPARRGRSASGHRPRRPRRGGRRALLVRLGLVWLALLAVATVAGAYSERVLHSTFAVDAAIAGGVCSAVVALVAFLSAAERKP